MLRDLLRRVTGRDEPPSAAPDEVTLVDVARELLSGSEESARAAARRWAVRQREAEERRAEAEGRRRAADWLAEKVRAGGGCWMPWD
jgi:hypothetical protein